MNLPATELADKLRSRFGPQSILSAPADVAPYLRDGSYSSVSDNVVVFRPRSTEELSAALTWLSGTGVELVTRGGGSGLAGGCVPRNNSHSVVVSTERMRAVRHVDPVGKVMIAESGVILADAHEAASRAGMKFGLNHGGAGSATIGGSIATNAGGAEVLRYGMARDQLLGVEAVLANGRVIDSLRMLRKDNSGFNLTQLLAGSEGTLAIITAASLKLRPTPIARQAALFGLADAAAAVELLQLAHAAMGEFVSSAELMSASALTWTRIRGGPAPPFETSWTLLVEAESTSAYFDLAGAFDHLISCALETGLAQDGVMAGSEAQRIALWGLREAIPEAMGAWRGPIAKTDTAVPPGSIPAFVDAIEAAAPPESLCVFFGHIGDGNIHVNFLPRPGQETRFAAQLPDLIRLVEDHALKLGGTISAEHGIGSSKIAALRRMRSSAELALMAGVKRVFDPAGRLNPGKVIDTDQTERGWTTCLKP